MGPIMSWNGHEFDTIPHAKRMVNNQNKEPIKGQNNMDNLAFFFFLTLSLSLITIKFDTNKSIKSIRFD
jgi:hypothetical protein